VINQVDYNFSTPKDSGLLEFMFQAAQTMGGVKFHSSSTSSIDLQGAPKAVSVTTGQWVSYADQEKAWR